MELVACTRQTEVVVKNQGECVAENPGMALNFVFEPPIWPYLGQNGVAVR